MAVDTTWTDPVEGGALDRDTDDVLTDAIYDKIISNLNALGGTDGYSGNKYPAKGKASATGTITTTSATYVDVTTMSVTLTANKAGSNLRVHFAANVWHSLNTEESVFALSLDGAAEVAAHTIKINAAAEQTVAGVYVFAAPGAGSHTIKMRWKTTGGTASMSTRDLIVVEEL